MRMPPGARILAIGVVVIAASSCDDSEQSLRRGDRVAICHATSSASNPFVQERPDIDGILSGHDSHPDDIIPQFPYTDDDGNEVTYDGKNLDQSDLLTNGCDASDPSPAETSESEEPETSESEEPETSESEGTETSESEGTETSESEGTETSESEGTETSESEGTETSESEEPETSESEGTETSESEGTETSESEEPETTESEATDTTEAATGTTSTVPSGTTTTVPSGTTTVPSGTTTTTVSPLPPIVEPEDPIVLDLGCVDCPAGPSIELPATSGIVYEVEPAGPWVPGQTVTVQPRAVDSASGFAETLPPGWTAVDATSASFEVTFSSGELPPTGSSSAMPQATAAAAAIALGSLLLVVRGRRRSTS